MSDVKTTAQNLKLKDLTIAVLGSHSALEVCLGAKKQGFKTLVVAQRGRELTYIKYFKNLVDETILLNNFKEILNKETIKKLNQSSVVFVPHRSFEVYVNDYERIEKDFTVPVFGNRFLLRAEERNQSPNQYDILKKAGIRHPKIFSKPSDIDRIVIVKVLEHARGFERAFFLASSPKSFEEESQKRLKKGIFTEKALNEAVIEEYILGVHVNFHYFYSPIKGRLELLGTDTRRQTNYEGLVKTLADEQTQILKHVEPKFEEAGHIAVTVLESFLEQAFEVGERFVKAAKNIFPPGVVGPLTLQGSILPGPPRKEFVVFDVSPRIGGSPGIKATPYSEYLFGKPVSMGERIAIEIKDAVEKGRLEEVVT